MTNENREEFAALVTEFELTGRTRKQMNAIRKGFNKLVPLRFLQAFTPDELVALFTKSSA